MNEIMKLVILLPPLGFAAMDPFHIPAAQENLGALSAGGSRGTDCRGHLASSCKLAQSHQILMKVDFKKSYFTISIK